MYRNCKILFIILILCVAGCRTAEKEIIRKTEIKNNFIITVYDSDIDNPENDRRCYYIVYIDKAEAGRTTTGLESQEKYFDAQIIPNRHLIKVEKWVLNESLGRYIKLNNIDQPKPDFIYINLEKGKVVRVNLKSSRTGNSSYSMTVE